MELLLQPAGHGAAGPWDEIVNLIPLVVGAVLLAYLYYTSRKHAQHDCDAEPEAQPPPDPPVF
jgi:hypothetical protein